MRFTLFFLSVFLLLGCEATAVKSTDAIKTKTKLNPGIVLPVKIPVALYVDKGKPETGVNFYGKLEEAGELVAKDMFKSVDNLVEKNSFYYVIKLSSNSQWDRFWGGWKSEVEIEIISNKGESLYTTSKNVTSQGGGVYDYNAVHNSFAKAIKDGLIEFLNSEGSGVINSLASSYIPDETAEFDYKDLIKDAKASSSGTGFFIDQNGTTVTAEHVVRDCLHIEVRHKGQEHKAEITSKSKLLDLAVLKTDFANSTTVPINAKQTPVTLGKQIFVTGFPLSGILSDYPSLTVGNISSLGGLKGAEGNFTFSAPVQPGSSGGAIVDYSGNLVGVVTSSLNQKMLLDKSGTASQNVNFGIDVKLLEKFLDKNNISRNTKIKSKTSFEKASAEAVEFTTQVLCYQ